ncbi:MAG: GNAT family N-acetyltransferase, partial [Acidocella sp.]|nr:GNAT family N-acetyltransferase [Acidocella sp.]
MPYTIRAMTAEDHPAISFIRNLPRARRGTLAMPFESLARSRNFFAKNSAPPDRFLVACTGDTVVGLAGLHGSRLARRAHAASVGITVHDEWAGKGVGTALFAALTDLADNWLGLRRLELSVFPDNAPAVALYTKFGFVPEGVERDDSFREGAFTDSQFMARLRGDLPRDVSPYPSSSAVSPPGPFSLRGVEPEDLPAITDMMNQPRVRHGTLRLPFCIPAEIAHLADPPDPATRAIVADIGGRASGLIMLSP